MKRGKIFRASLLLGLFFACCPHSDVAQQEATISDAEIKVDHFEEMAYPAAARAANVQGVVVVRVSLDDRGNVTKAGALSGTGVLAKHCVANAMKWKFKPNAHSAAIIVYSFSLVPADCGSASSIFMLHGVNFVTITACAMTVETTH